MVRVDRWCMIGLISIGRWFLEPEGGSVTGKLVEFARPMMAPAPVLIAIILADLVTAGLLVRELLHGRKRSDAE